MNCKNIVLNTVARQYNEKWRFPQYDCAIKKLQCYGIHSFALCNPENLENSMNEYEVPVYVGKFCPTLIYNHILATANENGTVCVENTFECNYKTYVRSHNNTVFDLAWMPGSKQFVTVSGDHSARLWDCGESDVKLVSEFLGHTRSVKCIYFKPENTSVFATGSRDGSLIIWDARCSSKCSKLPRSHAPDQVIPSAAGTTPFIPRRKYIPIEASQSNSVTGLIFQNDLTLISTGSSDQCVRVWDMRKTYSRNSTIPLPKYQFHAPSPGFSSVCIDPAGVRVYANSMDSYIYCFNAISYHQDPISAYCGHQNGSFYIKSCLSHDSLYLFSGSSDKNAYVWNTRKAELSDVAIKPMAVLPGHTAEVACIATSAGGDLQVATCSDDGTYRIWHNYTVDRFRDEDDVVDTAEDYDDEGSITVRTEWKNKKKRRHSYSDDDFSSSSDEFPCTVHPKICRYYSNSLSSLSCKCQRHVNPVFFLKRSLDNESETNDSSTAKRPSMLGSQGSTRLQAVINRISIRNLNRSTISNSLEKNTLKRKSSELPDIIDECESKRKAYERNLLAGNDLQMNKCENEREGVEAGGESQGAKFDYAGKNKRVEFEEHDDQKDCEKYSKKTEFSSPTTNLPNYVKDGTSPYIHRCPRTRKGNIDWLTELRKRSVKPPDVSQAEDQECSSKTSKNEGKVQVIGNRRKMVRSNSTEGKNPTLHKYFKVSSTSSDISYMPEDINK